MTNPLSFLRPEVCAVGVQVLSTLHFHVKCAS